MQFECHLVHHYLRRGAFLWTLWKLSNDSFSTVFPLFSSNRVNYWWVHTTTPWCQRDHFVLSHCSTTEPSYLNNILKVTKKLNANAFCVSSVLLKCLRLELLNMNTNWEKEFSNKIFFEQSSLSNYGNFKNISSQ